MATSTIFSGSSRYANDFSQVIERSMALASLPITQLGSQRGKLTDQSSALNGLAASVATLRNALENVEEAKTALQVNSSDSTSVGAQAELSALPGTYSIQVLSTGSRTTVTSKDTLSTVSDYLQQNISSASSFRLTAGGSTFTVTPKNNSLSSLVEAINGNVSHGVQAVIVNLGSSSAPDYRISLQSTKLGPVSVQLEELDGDQRMLLDEVTQGTLASYRINGQPSGSPLTTDTAAGISVAPGIKVDLLKEGSSDVKVSADKSKLTGALASLASAYNKLMSDVDQSRGVSDSALAAHTAVTTISQSLRKMMGYSSTGAVKSLEQIGFSFSESGMLSFDSAKFDALVPADAAAFLGEAGGDGLLARADDILSTIDEETTGLLPSFLKSIQDQIGDTDRQVLANQERLELLRQRLASQMAEADALIGLMEQQVSYMNGLFEAMRANAQ